jgi:hypothetical protein
MATSKTKSSTRQKKLDDYRTLQEEMLTITRQYSQERLAVWVAEVQSLQDTWSGFSQEWQSNLEQMSAQAGSTFEEMAAQGETSAGLLAQSWQKNLTNISGSVDQWGTNILDTLTKVASAWGTTTASQSSSGDGWSSLLSGVLDFGGWFHQGGIVEAHQGMVISPGTLMSDEQLIMAQKGEGVLPRESMTQLGEKNFEAPRTDKFDLAGGKISPRFDETIKVQTLVAAGVAGLDWDRLVQRHLVPALRQEADRRW